MRALFATLVCVLALGLPSFAHAESTIELVRFRGKHSAAIQKSVKRVLKAEGYKVVVVDSRGENTEAIASITAKIKKKKKRWTLQIKVWAGDEEEPLARTTLKARKPKALVEVVEGKLWKRVRSSVQLASELDESDGFEDEFEDEEDEKEDESRDEDESKDKDKETPVSEEKEKGPPLASTKGPAFDGSIALGPRIVNRRFGYKGDLFKSLTTFTVPAMAALVLDAEYYPLPAFGVIGTYSQIPSFDSELNDATNTPFPTTSMSFTAGVRYRTQISGIASHIDAEYGGHNFTIKGPMAEKPPIPNVRYRFVRVGGGATLPLVARVSAQAEAGYRHLLSAGEIERAAYFPRLSGAAIDARLAFDMIIVGPWRVEIAGTYERYFFSMNPQPGDTLIAGGAADQYIGGQLLLKYQPGQ